MNNADVSKRPVLLLVAERQSDSFSVAILRNEVAKRGFQLEVATTMPSHDLADLIGIAINAAPPENVLETSFLLARRSQERRAAEQVHLPITIINCSRDVSPSVRADFLRYGCYVVTQATPEQITDLLDTALVDAKRRSRRGITFSFRCQLAPLMIYAAREEELPAKGRLLSLLIALSRERREFSSPELAAILNCNTIEVKVYVDRLRRLIVNTGRKLGIAIGKHEVIQNSGKKGGYHVHANIAGRFPPEQL